MPLYAILHSDIEGLHEKSCTLVQAASPIEIAQHMLDHSEQWKPLLFHLYPDDHDPRSLWQRIQVDVCTPEVLLELIDKTYCDEPAEMMRIQPVQVQYLDQVRVETRWISTDVVGFSDSVSKPPFHSTAQTSFQSTVEELIGAYTQLRQRKGRELSVQIRQMTQQVAAELEAIRQQELGFTALQRILLEQLCTHFAVDARSLLMTPDFQRFVQSMFVTTEGETSATLSLQVAQNPMNWALNTLPNPLQLDNIQTIKPSEELEITQPLVQMQVNLGRWSQTLTVPIGESKDGILALYQPLYTTRQWIEVGDQLQKNLVQLPIAPDLQLGLAQELVCLLTYIGELFNIAGIVDRLSNLQV